MTTRSAPFLHIAIRRPSAQKKGSPGGANQAVDVSDRVTGFKFTDTEKGADKATFSVENQFYQNFDDPLFVDGNILEVSFGYPEVSSPVREFVINKVTGGAKLSVEALGKAYLLMTEKRTRTFGPYITHSEIAEQIAREYEFDADHTFVTPTTEVEALWIQGGVTDHQVLQEIARRNGFVHWIDFRGFHWGKRDLKQKPRRGFIYFTDPGQGDITSPPHVENDITGKPATIVTKGIDPKTKQPITGKGDNDTTKRDGLSKVLVITKTGAAGDYKDKHSPKAPNPTGSSAVVATSDKTQAAAQAAAGGAYGKMQLGAVQLTFTAVGDPLMEAKTLITVSGIGQDLSGNYYVTEVSHSLSGNYTMTIKCRRDGLNNSAMGPGNSSVNQSAASQNKAHADDPKATGADSKETMLVPISKTGAAGQVIFVPKGGAKK